MADVASAGTIVGAVLETAGYLAQEKLLVDFHSFFERFGVLIFLIGCSSAVVSAALYANYRFALYLIIGPTAFWFLVGTQSSSGGVVWRVADKSVRTEGGRVVSEAEGAKAVRKQIAQQEDGGGGELLNKDSIILAWPFRTYTRFVDGVVRGLSGLILQHKDDEALMALAKAQALNALTNAQIDDGDLINMFREELFGKCNDMMIAASHLASPGVSERKRLTIQETKAVFDSPDVRASMDAADADILVKRAEYQKRYQSAAEGNRVNIGRSFHTFMVRQQYTAGSKAQEWLNTNYPGQKMEDVPPGATMTCQDVWSIIQEAIYENAYVFAGRLEKSFESYLSEDGKGKLCPEISRKIGRRVADDNSEQCNLVEVTAIFLIRNAILRKSVDYDSETSISPRHYSDIIQTTHDRMGFLETIPDGTLQVMDGDQRDLELIGGVHNPETRVGQVTIDPLNPSLEPGKRIEAKFLNKRTGDEEWHSVMVVPAIAGEKEAAFVEHQRYQTRELRQKIFTMAMQFPYFQGIVLFLLALGYPFFALIVLVPGRAGAFMSYLMAWLWIKSWDIGWACVIVLEKVLWNLFPNVDFDTEFPGGSFNPTAGTPALPHLLREAFRIDPSYNVHAYYFFISLAVMLVPVITGYATLKFRSNAVQSILGAFTDKMKNSAEDAGSIAGGSYGMDRMNEFNRRMKKFQGAAQLTQGFQGVGLEGNGRAEEATRWASLATQAGVWSKSMAGSTGILSTLRDGLAAVQQRPADFIDNYNKVLSQIAQRDSLIAKVFHPQLGRFGEYAMRTESVAAALDGSGGFEINEKDGISNMLTAIVKNVNMKAEIAVKADANMAVAKQGIIGKIPVLRYLNVLEGAIEGMKDGKEWLEKVQTGSSPLERQIGALENNPNALEALVNNPPELLRFWAQEIGLSNEEYERLTQQFAENPEQIREFLRSETEFPYQVRLDSKTGPDGKPDANSDERREP